MHTILPKILEDSLEIKGMKLGLERMRAFDAALGSPSHQFKSVHIAGTNGKGSVATKIASAFPGKKVGLFTSPHIETYRERIQINGVWIDAPVAEQLLQQIIEKLDESPTYFELLTLLAFVYFAEQQVDLAVLEVGMGGRLDATNIVTPLLSVITSIDLDHTQYLGATVEEIAREKGGIIKPEIPVVVGPRACYYPNAIEVHGSFAHYEEENQAIARAALKELGVEVCDLSDVPSCRFECIGNRIFDVGHNPAALQRTFERIAHTYPGKKIRAFVAFSADKDIAACLEVIEKHTCAYHFIKVDHPRLHVYEQSVSFDEALQHCRRDEILLVTGTFFMMAAAKKALLKEL